MNNLIRETFEQGDGIFRMIPALIPIKFGLPGRRLKLHPDDYFAFGADAGTIMERWLCSFSGCRVKNPKRPDQGLSYVNAGNGEKFLLKDAAVELKEELIGKELQDKYGIFPVFSKFFDYRTPLYFHFHPREEVARRVGCGAKPECYYFPPQLNNYPGQRPTTYFGFNAGVTKEDVRRAIENFSNFDTRITDMSRAYTIAPGQGWYVPAGVIHAPGSLLTYEPQWGTDLNCVLENVVDGEVFDEHYMTDIVPEDVENKVDYIMDAKARERNLPILCEIRINGFEVFRFVNEGAKLHNALWAECKFRTVELIQRSSLRALYMPAVGEDDLFSDLQHFDRGEYALLGGGFPIRLKGTGMIGSIAISGLPHTEDHELIVESMSEYLGKETRHLL